jgi:two-component system cell cycle response regulator DivK
LYVATVWHQDDLTMQLKANPATAAIPVIAITAQAMRGEEATARAAGCDAYLTKPLETQAFRELLRRFVGNAGRAG